MKLIAFALAAIAFSGSSKSRESADNNPVEPAKPAEPAKPVDQPSNTTPPLPVQDVQISKEEKALLALRTTVQDQEHKLILSKTKAETEIKAFKDAQSMAKLAEKERKDAENKLWQMSQILEPKSEDGKAKLEAREQELKAEVAQKRELEKKAIENEQTSKTRAIDAKAAYNEELGKMDAALRDFKVKADRLVQTANENAKSSAWKTKSAEVELRNSQEALKKPLKMVENYKQFPAMGTPQDRVDADKMVAAAKAKIAEHEAALAVAQSEETAAKNIAKDLQSKRSEYDEYYKNFMKQHKNY